MLAQLHDCLYFFLLNIDSIFVEKDEIHLITSFFHYFGRSKPIRIESKNILHDPSQNASGFINLMVAYSLLLSKYTIKSIRIHIMIMF